MGQSQSNTHVHDDVDAGQLPRQGSITTQADQFPAIDNTKNPKATPQNLLDLPPEITVRIAAYAQADCLECQKNDTRDDQIAVLWRSFENMAAAARTEAIELGLGLEQMVDPKSGHPIVHVVHYIGPKAGYNVTATKLHPIFRVCRRFRRERDDFIRSIHFQVNLRDKAYIPWAIRDALIAILKEFEHLPMLRHLKIAFYNTDEGHRPLQRYYTCTTDPFRVVDTKQVSEWYSKVLHGATDVHWADREIRAGGSLTPESWLSFVYELRDADIAVAMARIKVWRDDPSDPIHEP
ncbi:hypothetical protein FKW77_007933 [Venturia effusa]|uniref:Uncharacterized protein n=1 Tax=Venturia effusa TaxID=50376 RepID=A0A517L7R4_9PEZI|nr:hypothetical protein FKW77_007933 [Venturia effusa]